MEERVNIAGIDKLALTRALWENSFYAPAAIRFGTNQPWNASVVSHTVNFSFDYLFGKVMKVDLNGNEADPWGYDRDVGTGELAKIVKVLKACSSEKADPGILLHRDDDSEEVTSLSNAESNNNEHVPRDNRRRLPSHTSDNEEDEFEEPLKEKEKVSMSSKEWIRDLINVKTAQDIMGNVAVSNLEYIYLICGCGRTGKN
ncbi:hypothetical protein B0H14DRAFT_2712527 [Mycena olivaceomarginata]|nr:hypothetical protein B0H14DRAFT_2712527 [Mycena olivaceomarginata]